jgi:DNA-binding NtrC family response regulator
MKHDPSCRVLVVDDGPDLRQQVRASLAPAPGRFEIDSAGPGAEALACAAKARAEGRPYEVVFAAPGPPPGRPGLESLARLREEHPRLEAIVCGGETDSWEADLAAKLPGSEGCLFLKMPLEAGTVRHLALFLARMAGAFRQAGLEREPSVSLPAAAEAAHKVEPVGQLAGRIAHDFNNLLTVISGHAGMLMSGPPASAKAADSLKEIAAATRRASELTRQLMTLSRKQAPPPQPAAPAALPSGEKEAIGGAGTILVVEDEAPLLKLMRYVLESYGYKVLDSSAGKAALEIWEQRKNEIDLLVSGLTLPDGMGGQELAKILQAEKPGLKIIYTSGYDTGRLAGDFPPAKGVAFLQKPFHARKLAETVFDLLREK